MQQVECHEQQEEVSGDTSTEATFAEMADSVQHAQQPQFSSRGIAQVMGADGGQQQIVQGVSVASTAFGGQFAATSSGVRHQPAAGVPEVSCDDNAAFFSGYVPAGQTDFDPEMQKLKYNMRVMAGEKSEDAGKQK